MANAVGARLLSSLPAILAGSILLTGVLLLPDLTPDDIAPTVGQATAQAIALEQAGVDENGVPILLVEIVDGPDAGEQIEAFIQDASGALPGSSRVEPYAAGDRVVVTQFTGEAGGFAVVSEPWRVPLLGLLAALFVVAVLVVAGVRGLRALLALALTLAVIVKIVVPLFIGGWDPVLLAVGVGAAITVAVLTITEGASRVTLAAVLGTFAALALTALLAAVFNRAAEFTALQGNESIGFLIPLIGERADLQGILLAATVFGALGVLDDVTVTQAATVEQLHAADPASGRGSVIGRAMRVGRSHIAATVNTLMLAYLGAGLPLLLLFALSGQSPLLVLNGELLAVEVIRALVGSIGIVAAVPLTTLVAALLVVPGSSEP
ncbi:MAG: YibE/F family protein [Candidatus Limnocylindria bacterium]